MMLVYKGAGAVLVPDAHITAEPGVPVEIHDAEIAASLLQRPDWRKAPAKKEG